MCLLFVIPFETVTVDRVKSVRSEYIPPQRIRRVDRVSRSNRFTEAVGNILIEGSNAAELKVSPANLAAHRKRIIDYVTAPTDAPLTLFTTANWKISIFCGIWAGFFLLIYLIYILSWTVPQELQWKLAGKLLDRLPPIRLGQRPGSGENT